MSPKLEIIAPKLREWLRQSHFFEIIPSIYFNYLMSQIKYVVSFTTSPKRIKECHRMVKSLIRQYRKPDLILLNIPKEFGRTGETYEIPPPLPSCVTINQIDRDYGPITKVWPTILYLRSKSYDMSKTRIIYVDDDIYYPPRMVSTYAMLHRKYRRIPTIFSASGFNYENENISHVSSHCHNVDVVEGFGSVSVLGSMFGDDFAPYLQKVLENKDAYMSDDIIISNYFKKENIPMKIVNQGSLFSLGNMVSKGCIMDYGNESDALHLGADGMTTNNVNRYLKVIKFLREIEEFYLF